MARWNDSFGSTPGGGGGTPASGRGTTPKVRDLTGTWHGAAYPSVQWWPARGRAGPADSSQASLGLTDDCAPAVFSREGLLR